MELGVEKAVGHKDRRENDRANGLRCSVSMAWARPMLDLARPASTRFALTSAAARLIRDDPAAEA